MSARTQQLAGEAAAALNRLHDALEDPPQALTDALDSFDEAYGELTDDDDTEAPA